MDSAFRFGEISVSCEGFDYPDDPYILKGSCGVSSVANLPFLIRLLPSRIIRSDDDSLKK